MVRTAWTLSADGRDLSIFKIESTTRRLTLVLPLRRILPMTEAEAQKYVDDNYPNDGSVRAAADTLGLLRGK
jgi:hypothetical protein